MKTVHFMHPTKISSHLCLITLLHLLARRRCRDLVARRLDKPCRGWSEMASRLSRMGSRPADLAKRPLFVESLRFQSFPLYAHDCHSKMAKHEHLMARKA